MDERQQSIVFQSSLERAITVLMHNSKGEKIDIKEAIDLAKRIALVALNPQLDKFRDELKLKGGERK